jgi:hypothetical protein
MEMTRSSQIFRNATISLLLVFLAQACVSVDAPPALPTAQEIASPVVGEKQPDPLPTPTATFEPAGIPSLPTETSLPLVTLNVVKGNLFIRRGPDMAFNPVGVLYKNTNATVIARDVLSKWVQVEVPNSSKTGWVSIQTEYSQVEGDLENLPQFTPTEWPQAAYLRNCTYHRMYLLPSEVVIPPSFQFPDNEIWIYPGEYVVYDIDVPDDPEVARITVKEGSEIEIREDGMGGKRKCP